jgi:DtxR family Mn-dependent transcriptional regulator
MSYEFQNKPLSKSLQDYLRIILDLINEKHVARIRDISLKKGVSMPSVTEAARRLSQEGYVEYTAREFIELTEKGKEVAHHLANLHTFLTNFLEEILNLDTKKAEKEACVLEHHLSKQTLERLILLYQFLIYCPKKYSHLLDDYQKCIEMAKGKKPTNSECALHLAKNNFPHYHNDIKTTHTLLSEMESGQEGYIMMLRPNLLSYSKIFEKGLYPNTKIKIERAGSEDKPFLVSTEGFQIEVDFSLAQFIEVAIKE